MTSLKNWDNKTWLSSKKYITAFNNFILKQKKLNKYSIKKYLHNKNSKQIKLSKYDISGIIIEKCLR